MDHVSKELMEKELKFLPMKAIGENNEVTVYKPEIISVDKYYTIKYFKKKEFSICKALLPMKIAIFIWFAAASSVMPFFNIFYKSRGLTVQDVSLMFVVTPFLQFLATSALGALADRIGRAKPILVLNLVACAALVLLLVAMPEVGSGAMAAACDGGNVTHLSIARGCGRNLTSVGDGFSRCAAVNVTDGFRHINGTTPTNGNDGFLRVDNFCFPVEERTTLKENQLADDERCLISCAEARNVSARRPAWVLAYAAMQLVFITGYVNVFRFIDVTLLALVAEHKSDYGRERFFGVLGSIIGPVVSSLLVEWTSEAGDTNYSAAFYLFAVLSTLCALLVAVRVDVRPFGAGTTMMRKAMALFKRPKFVVFVLVLLVQGSTWGFFINFKGWYLQDMGLESYKIGLLDTINAIYGLPILLYSRYAIKRLGVDWIFVIAFAARTVYCLGYSFLVEPWLAFLLELTCMFGYHLFWVAAMNFSNSLAIPGIIASVNSLAGSIHFTIGRSTGSLIGGFLMNAYKGPTAFQVLGGMNLAFGLAYALFLLRKNPSCK